MSKKKVAVAMSGTANLAFAMANVLIGIDKYSPGFVDEVVVYHQGMSQNDQDCLSKIAPCKFIEYKGHELINSLPPTDNISKYSIMSFAIYEIFKLTEEYENVIYLDADLLIQKDISDILLHGPVSMGAGRLTINEACGQEVIDKSIEIYAKSSGVVIINDQIRNGAKLTKECYQKTHELWNTLVFPDQAIINLIMHENNIPIGNLPLTYNTGKASKNLHNACVVHTQGGKSKFWNNGISNIMFPEWNRNNDIWLSLGGTPFTGPRYYWAFHGMSQVRLFEIIKQANAHGIDMKS